MANSTVAATDLRRGLADILIRIHRGEVIELTQYGRRVAVLVPPDLSDRLFTLLDDATQNDE